VDVEPHYGLLSVQGPKAIEALTALEFLLADRQPTPDPSQEGTWPRRPAPLLGGATPSKRLSITAA